MLRFYIKTAIRQLKKFGSLSTITILGLAVGFTCVLLLSAWVSHEMQFDRFYDKTDRIYKVYLEESINGNNAKHPWVSFPLSKVLRDEIPEIENSTIIKGGAIKVRYNDQIYYENRTCFCEAGIFDVFDLDFIRGDKKDALSNKESIVISEKIATKYFGKEDPVGKTIIVYSMNLGLRKIKSV